MKALVQHTVWLLIILVAAFGCGGEDGVVVDVSGAWLDVAEDGSHIVVTFSQSGEALSGMFASSSGWSGTVSGGVSGDEIGFTYIYSDGYRVYSKARIVGDEMVNGLFWSLDGLRYGRWTATRVFEDVQPVETTEVRRPEPEETGPSPLQAVTTIRLNTVFFPGGPIVLSDLIEQNIRFGSSSGVTHSDIGDPQHPDNGTPFMLLDAGQTPLIISNATSASFSVMAIDLAEFSTAFAAPRSIPFVGHKTDGSTVTRTFILDGVMDGSGPLNDYETFSFGNAFRDLSYVEVLTDTYCLDNLVIGQ